MRRFISQSSLNRASIVVSSHARQQEKLHLLPPQHLAQMASSRFFMRSNEPRRQLTRKSLLRREFPDLEVAGNDGMKTKLPFRQRENVNADQATVPKASLLCLSFRANSQATVNSWSSPFIEAFSKSENVHVCEIRLNYGALEPVRRKPQLEGNSNRDELMVYSFRDHSYISKELNNLDLDKGYIFLLDKLGRIRWYGFGMASDKKIACLHSFTSALLNEEQDVLQQIAKTGKSEVCWCHDSKDGFDCVSRHCSVL